MELVRACWDKRIDDARDLLIGGADVDQEFDLFSEGYTDTPLMAACSLSLDIDWQQHLALVKLLLKFGADVNKPCSGSDMTALAFMNEAFEINSLMELLLDSGADVNVRYGSDSTPLIHASLHSYFTKVKLLLKYGADVNMTGDKGRTPLMAACGRRSKGVDDVVELLLERGADVNAMDSAGNTALKEALIHTVWQDDPDEQFNVVKMLIERGADLNFKISGEEEDNVKFSRKLIEAGQTGEFERWRSQYLLKRWRTWFHARRITRYWWLELLEPNYAPGMPGYVKSLAAFEQDADALMH